MFKILYLIQEIELKIVIDSFEEKKYKADDYEIKQWEEVNILYLVDTGK